MPRGAIAFAVNGRPSGAILTIESRGEVRAARKFRPHDAIFISTTATGEINAALAVEAVDDWNARIVKQRRNLEVAWIAASHRFWTASESKFGAEPRRATAEWSSSERTAAVPSS